MIGEASKHRKEHSFVDGIEGKNCSVAECGWKSLSEYNYSASSWDKYR